MKLAAVFFLVLLSSFQQAPLDALVFPTYNGGTFNGALLKNKKAVVFAFLMPDCPFCQKYSNTLNELNTQFKGKEIQFVGVITGDLYTDKEAKEFIRNYKISFPIIHDKNKKLISYYKISVSPAVVLSTNQGKSVYKGMIDNWAVSLGKTRQVITEHYLKDAISQFVAGKVVTVRNTEAVGCIIE